MSIEITLLYLLTRKNNSFHTIPLWKNFFQWKSHKTLLLYVLIYLLFNASMYVFIHVLIIWSFVIRYSRETRKSFERTKCISFEVGSLPRSCTLIHAVHHDNNYIIIVKISYNDFERIYVPSKILRLSYVLLADQYVFQRRSRCWRHYKPNLPV